MKSKVFTVFLFMILLLTSCDKLSDEDQSLTIKEYQEIGMPEHNRIWGLDDYTEATAILDNLKIFRPYALPRKDSKKSGAYFNRLISPENLSFIYDETIPLSERAHEIQSYFKIQGSLISAYTDLGKVEQYYNSELIDLYIFGITIAQNMLDLGQMINESVDEAEISMQYAYGSIQHVYVTMILFVLENQKKTGSFNADDLEKLTDFVANSIFLNKDWMQAASLNDLKLRLQDVMDNTTSEYIVETYSEVYEAL